MGTQHIETLVIGAGQAGCRPVTTCNGWGGTNTSLHPSGSSNVTAPVVGPVRVLSLD
jgi:hypothetical protein